MMKKLIIGLIFILATNQLIAKERVDYGLLKIKDKISIHHDIKIQKTITSKLTKFANLGILYHNLAIQHEDV
ncbi:MAG: hypothetical protein ACWIPH_02775 [Ostreibacterium sp.]